MTKITLGIYHYPQALKSAVYGLEEMFVLANTQCRQQGLKVQFSPAIFTDPLGVNTHFDVVILPPGTAPYMATEVLAWLRTAHQRGSVIASACTGSFMLAGAGVLHQRAVTTHWGLAESFTLQFPDQPLKTDAILIDHGDVISAGGLMSWVDLGLELVARYASAQVMRNLGKLLVVDTAEREQRFYQQFMPSFLHGDSMIEKLQRWLAVHLAQPITLKQLSQQGAVTERTLLRRFAKATGYTPYEYLQRLRIQRACELLETTTESFTLIANQVGYDDSGACRKAFIRIMGLTPSAFRQRFGR
ncbi:AraC family transcriptional regulator [Plesiomonas shigelloides]|uniref:GlxA family transcriptional regulator n=1 Tax=Plesiomonas shigelloides TaxID=703 RepID=UPI000D5670C4|nr:helix-turn-helix domain-containing protein [Plesiomonas shigelloides]PVU65079.1 AraC family transcriptional regulator [Plesiomonas shigelloides]